MTLSSQTDDPDTDEIFSREPAPKALQHCPYCRQLVTDEENAAWVVLQPTDDHYTPFCNVFHRDAFYKVGLWKDDDTQQELPKANLTLALPLEE